MSVVSTLVLLGCVPSPVLGLIAALTGLQTLTARTLGWRQVRLENTLYRVLCTCSTVGNVLYTVHFMHVVG